MQAPSTKAALSQTKEERAAHRAAVISKEAQCVTESGSIDLNVREITEKEYNDYQAFRIRRGAAFEEARTAYLMRAAKEGKIHHSLLDKIETNHVMPPLIIKEKAEEAFLSNPNIVQRVKEKFKKMMDSIFKPQHAEIMAEGIKKMREE